MWCAKVRDIWTTLTYASRNYRRMTKILFGCASITLVVCCALVSSGTSSLNENSTDPSYGYNNQSDQNVLENTNYPTHSHQYQDSRRSDLSTLALVQVLFRHGDRSPMQSYPTDPHKDEWPQGYGQLTKLGVMQGYQLGQFLWKRYSGFLGNKYNPKEVHIRSTNKDRTLMMAQSVAAGLFPYHSGFNESWPFGVWQPIPVHTLPQEWDNMLSPSKACTYVHELKYGLQAYFYSAQDIMKDKVTMFALSEYTGLEMNFTTLNRVADTVFCQKIHNMSQPKWLRQDMEDQLMGFYHRMPVLTPEEAKYLAGILLDTMINNMVNKAHNGDKHKVFLYSAHHGNLHTLMSLLGIFKEDTVIPFGAALILELHIIKHKLFVKFLFKTSDGSPPVPLHSSGRENDLCPLSVLTSLFEEPAETSWKQMCGKSHHENFIDFGENTIPILVAVLVAFIGLDFFLLYKTCIYRQRLNLGDKKEDYSLVQTEDHYSSDSEDEKEEFPKNHRHDHNRIQNGSVKTKKPEVNGNRYDVEHTDEDSYEETTLFAVPSKSSK